MSDFKGIEISDVFGLKEPLIKLIDCVSVGIGKVYEPTYIKRMAKAKKEEIAIIGEAITNNINLPAKYEEGKISIDTTNADELIKRTGNRLLYKELRKQQNIESVIAETYNLLDEEENVAKEPVNQDWLYKFFDTAGEISDEFMQKLWSKILAGEIKKPNTYTLRTLETLKNITKEEANLFNNLIKFVFFHNNDPIIYNDTKLLAKYGMNFNKLLKIEDCGLINLNGFVNLDFDDVDNYLTNNKIILLIEGKIQLGIYTLTESGKQIVNLIKDNIEFDEKYFIEFCKNIKDKNKNKKFKAYKIEKIEDKSISYNEKFDLLVDNERTIS